MKNWINCSTRHLSPFFFIDLMSREEFARQHIPGAVDIPVEELKARIGEIPGGSEIFVSGKRGLMKSGIALNLLCKSGFKNARKVGGGTMGWFASK